MKIIGMMRVRNEARWIERVLRSILPICEHVVVFDDHSDDGTPDICRALPGVTVIDSPFDGLNESRDKQFLLEKVAEFSPDFCIHIDGDEELMADDREALVNLCENGTADVFRFRVLYLWDRPDQVRMDRWYSSYRRSSLFRFKPGARFSGNGNGGNFHCGNVPAGPWSIADTEIRLLHYGYMSREDRIRKYEYYNAEDKQPIPESEDGYRHCVIGDLFPADSDFRWAGPLELQPLTAESR